ncbi:MAG: hypothetical protein LWX52_07725 [Deltaproteobacteria bacterium]|jgi:hypothetical protein|nr:hypothetical protein [Deltaproteobacteria bacterium]
MKDKDRSEGRIDTFAKLLPGIGAIIAGIFIPLVIHINGERSRSNQLYAEIVSKREMADTELRAKMFENLISCFFGDTSEQRSDNEKLTFLRLLALNFHESFDLKPLFESLEHGLAPEERYKVREIAKEVAGKQEAMLSHIEEGMTFNAILPEGGSTIAPHEDRESYNGHRLGIEVEEIGENDKYVRLHVIDIPENKDAGDIVDINFKVTPYDMPFVDNTKLFNGTRFAVVLKEIVRDTSDAMEKKAVTIKIIFFPERYMSSRDRPYLDEMLQQLRKTDRQ